MASDYGEWAAKLTNDELAGYLEHIRSMGAAAATEPAVEAALTEAAIRLRGDVANVNDPPSPAEDALETLEGYGFTGSDADGLIVTLADVWRCLTDDADMDDLSPRERELAQRALAAVDARMES
jgi:hypothetical protein